MADAPQPPVQPPVPPARPQVPAWLNRANALGLNDDETILFKLMHNSLSFTEGQYITLRDQGGYSTLRDLNQWRHKEIYDWCVTMSGRSVARGGRTYGDLKIKQLQGIAWWVTDCCLRSLPLDVNDFKAKEEEYRANAQFAYLESNSDDVILDKPGKFEYKNWIAWEETVYLYFDSITNLRGVPVAYVIRKDLPAGTDIATLERKEQIIYNAPLNGFVFDIDTKAVLSILKESTINTEAETWIKNIKCGRIAMKALQQHYDGDDEKRKRLDTAKAQLDKLFYCHEATFSFEKYVTSLQNIFSIHDHYFEPVYETDKVRYDYFIHEADRTMATISAELSQDLMVENLKSNVRISSTYTNKRHHGTDAALLSRKWGIGLKTAQDTLKSTTQLNIRSAVLPLTRRYRTDLVSQRLRRLSCRF